MTAVSFPETSSRASAEAPLGTAAAAAVAVGRVLIYGWEVQVEEEAMKTDSR
jgi:hypothetical protein